MAALHAPCQSRTCRRDLFRPRHPNHVADADGNRPGGVGSRIRGWRRWMIVIVESRLQFDEFDRFDALLHVCLGDITLRHEECEGGAVVVVPPPFKRKFLGGCRRSGRPAPAGVRLVCTRCHAQSEAHGVDRVSRSLRLFLVAPDASTAPAQPIAGGDRFAPPGWPPRRRRKPDRRAAVSRYHVDRSMEGRRRSGHDRRKDPLLRDVPAPV
jgi:hypothetical protein